MSEPTTRSRPASAMQQMTSRRRRFWNYRRYDSRFIPPYRTLVQKGLYRLRVELLSAGCIFLLGTRFIS